MVGGTMLAGLIVMPLITLVVGYYIAVLTSRFGLDPDNQGVPFITSLLDLAGVVGHPPRYENIRGTSVMDEQPRTSRTSSSS